MARSKKQATSTNVVDAFLEKYGGPVGTIAKRLGLPDQYSSTLYPIVERAAEKTPFDLSTAESSQQAVFNEISRWLEASDSELNRDLGDLRPTDEKVDPMMAASRTARHLKVVQPTPDISSETTEKTDAPTEVVVESDVENIDVDLKFNDIETNDLDQYRNLEPTNEDETESEYDEFERIKARLSSLKRTTKTILIAEIIPDDEPDCPDFEAFSKAVRDGEHKDTANVFLLNQPKGDKKYRFCGVGEQERRARAQHGFEEMEAVIWSGTEDDEVILGLETRLIHNRENPSEFAKARNIARYKDPEFTGGTKWPDHKIAAYINRGAGKGIINQHAVGKSIRMYKQLAPSMWAKLEPQIDEDGEILFDALVKSVAYELASAFKTTEFHPHQIAIADATLENTLSIAEVKQLIKFVGECSLDELEQKVIDGIDRIDDEIESDVETKSSEVDDGGETSYEHSDRSSIGHNSSSTRHVSGGAEPPVDMSRGTKPSPQKSPSPNESEETFDLKVITQAADMLLQIEQYPLVREEILEKLSDDHYTQLVEAIKTFEQVAPKLTKVLEGIE